MNWDNILRGVEAKMRDSVGLPPKICFNRLSKMANHLREGQLAHEKFGFGTWHIAQEREGNMCNTLGCACGELPAVFPQMWEYRRVPYNPESAHITSQVALKGKDLWQGASIDSAGAMAFFGLTDKEFRHLFIPRCQILNTARWLQPDATKEAVAANIEDFIAHKGYREEK